MKINNVLVVFDVQMKRVIAILGKGVLFTVCLTWCVDVYMYYSTVLTQSVLLQTEIG